MITDPYPKIAQFMSAGAGLGTVGKKAKIHKKNRNRTAVMLIGSPHLPKLNFDGSSGSPRIRFNATHEIEIMYVVNMAETPRARTCWKATADPKVIKDSKSTKMIVTYDDLSGTPNLGETCAD